jgi:hypothetical protein
LPTFVNILFRKKALKRDADLVQLQSLREDVSCLEKYLALLREDSVIESAFVQSVQNHLSALKNEARNGSLTAPSLTMLAEAQTLQKLVAQTPPDSKAAQFALLLAQVAADNEGVPGVRDGLKYLPPEPVPDQNVFHWNPETDLVTHTTRLPIL